MDILGVYKKIYLIRCVELAIDGLFSRGLINGTAHYCIGQEFIPVIVSEHVDRDDVFTSTHRGHGHALAKNLEIKPFLAELLGRRAGYNSGKGGTQHVMSADHNFYANGITGGMVPVATGMALAFKYSKRKNIVVPFLGDGAMLEGYVLEALNMAVALSLPVLFVCENNHYAMGTHTQYTHSSSIIEKACGFGLHGELIELNDYEKLDRVVAQFVTEIRRTCSPRFIEVQTYRHRGHSKNDKNLYRNKDEESLWFEHDVLLKLERKIVDGKLMSSDELSKIRDVIKQDVDDVVEEVISMEEHDVSRVEDHVYVSR